MAKVGKCRRADAQDFVGFANVAGELELIQGI